MNELLKGLLDWVQLHPGWTLALTGVFCAGESILVLGALIPTTLVLCAVGALVALNVLDFWPVVGAATAGAVAGDFFNFWVGRRYGERVLQSPRAQPYQAAIERSRELFRRHGAKSLVFARFVGLVRPFVAGIAGAYRMPVWVFLLVDAAAALVWAMPLIAVGVALGASLGLAAEVATRLVVLLVALLLVVWFAFWLARYAVLTVQGHAEEWIHSLLDWSHAHRRLGRLGEALADPEQPETPGLAILAGVLLLLGAGWLTLWWGLGWREYPPALDALVYQGLQGLQVPAATSVAVALAQLGEWQVYGPTAVAVLAALAWTSRDRAAAHWIAAVAFAGVISLALFALPTFSTPLEYYRGELRAYFSGRELVLATVIYGFIPVLLSTRRNVQARVRFYGSAITLLLLIVLAELYLGAQWISMALFAVALGALWVTALGLGYRRHRAERVAAPRFVPVVVGTFVVAAAVHAFTGYEPRLDAARPKWVLDRMAAAQWIAAGYAQLPAQRVDMAGRPKLRFNVQWAGDLKRIETLMAAQGWAWPVRLSGANVLRWLAPEAQLGLLPQLPQVHAGRYQALMLRRGLDDNAQHLLQLWPSTWRIEGGERIWVGNITVQQGRTRLRWLRYPTTVRDAQVPAETLLGQLPGITMTKVADEEGRPVWLLRDE